MGIYKENYVIIGYKMPYHLYHKDTEKELDIYEDDSFLPYIEGHKGIDYILISDGMSGEYIVFGKVIFTSDDVDNGEFIELDFNYDSESIKTKYIELFYDYLDINSIGDPKILAFSHFS